MFPAHLGPSGRVSANLGETKYRTRRCTSARCAWTVAPWYSIWYLMIHGYAECALVGFPDSSNVGDSAIWMGELAWLRDAGVRVAYRCHERDYDANILAQRSPNGLILLHGGGNLGDLWPRLQRLREKVIQDFPQRSIVQLPQTIHFGDRGALEQARAVFDDHPDLTIMVRDTTSFDFARREFRCRTELCPDMAFYLGALSSGRVKDVDVLWLRRTDLEAVPESHDLQRVEVGGDQPGQVYGAAAGVGEHPRQQRRAGIDPVCRRFVAQTSAGGSRGHCDVHQAGAAVRAVRPSRRSRQRRRLPRLGARQLDERRLRRRRWVPEQVQHLNDPIDRRRRLHAKAVASAILAGLLSTSAGESGGQRAVADGNCE